MEKSSTTTSKLPRTNTTNTKKSRASRSAQTTLRASLSLSLTPLITSLLHKKPQSGYLLQRFLKTSQFGNADRISRLIRTSFYESTGFALLTCMTRWSPKDSSCQITLSDWTSLLRSGPQCSTTRTKEKTSSRDWAAPSILSFGSTTFVIPLSVARPSPNNNVSLSSTPTNQRTNDNDA